MSSRRGAGVEEVTTEERLSLNREWRASPDRTWMRLLDSEQRPGAVEDPWKPGPWFYAVYVPALLSIPLLAALAGTDADSSWLPSAGVALLALAILSFTVGSVRSPTWLVGSRSERARPHPRELTRILRKLDPEDWGRLLRRLDRAGADVDPAAAVTLLDQGGWEDGHVAYHALAADPGPAVDRLIEIAHRVGSPDSGRVARILLRELRDESTRIRKRGPGPTICTRCLDRWERHPKGVFVYHGCRVCGSAAHAADEVVETIVAVLDRGMDDATRVVGSSMEVDWLRRGGTARFDRVRIVDATDSEVEAFLIDVGNDTDPVRRDHYGSVRVEIASGCALTENTLRLLEAGPLGRVKRLAGGRPG